MKDFCVIGCGRFGSNLAITLEKLGKNVLAIDRRKEIIDSISPHVTHAVIADAVADNVLRDLGVQNMDCVVIALSDNFEGSVYLTADCKELGVPRVIVKARDSKSGAILKKVGADEVVVPERDMGLRLAHFLSSSGILDYIELNNELSIVQIKLPKAWEGKTIADLNVRKKYDVNIVAVKEGDDYYVNFDPEEKLPNDATVFLIGKGSGIKKIEKLSD